MYVTLCVPVMTYRLLICANVQYLLGSLGSLGGIPSIAARGSTHGNDTFGDSCIGAAVRSVASRRVSAHRKDGCECAVDASSVVRVSVSVQAGE